MGGGREGRVGAVGETRLLSRRPRRPLLLLQHGPDGGRHHGGGHGRGQRSQGVLCAFTGDVDALEVPLACGGGEDGEGRAMTRL